MPSQIINFWFVTCCFIVCNSFSFTCKWFCNSHVLCCISIQLLCPFFHIYYFQLLLSKVFRFINISNQNVPTASITSMIAQDIPEPSCKQVFYDRYSSSTKVFGPFFELFSFCIFYLAFKHSCSISYPYYKNAFCKNQSLLLHQKAKDHHYDSFQEGGTHNGGWQDIPYTYISMHISCKQLHGICTPRNLHLTSLLENSIQSQDQSHYKTLESHRSTMLTA